MSVDGCEGENDMRLFTLANVQNIVLYLFPSLIFLILFGLGLGYAHFGGVRGEDWKKVRYNIYAGEIEERRSPWPVVLLLIIFGTILWGLLYTWGIGRFVVRI
jgi:hypothetical protein